MIIKKYQHFLESQVINENVAQAKSYLRKRALQELRKENPDMGFVDIKKLDDIIAKSKVDPASVKSDIITASKIKKMADENPTFLHIKQKLKDGGYTYPFVKFHFENNVPLDELFVTSNPSQPCLLDRLMDLQNKQQLKNLPMQVGSYADLNPEDDPLKTSGTIGRTGYERLLDDLTMLEGNAALAKFTRELPKEYEVKNENDKLWFGKILPSLRGAIQNSKGEDRKELVSIAREFERLDSNPKDNKSLADTFFLDCLKIRPDVESKQFNLKAFIQEAKDYIEAVSKSSVKDLLLNITQANEKYGINNGAEIIYNKLGIVIFEVRSFQANILINAAANHCIKNWNQWQNYVCGAPPEWNPPRFNKQYYIWNFNKSKADRMYIIGVTVEPGSKIRAAHDKDDGPIANIKEYVKKEFKIKFEDYFLPMSDVEITTRKKRMEADRKIVQPYLSLEELAECLEDGADPNFKEGKPLEEAVKENNIEKVKFLISKGARATIGKPMRFAQSFEMILLLVKNNAPINSKAIENCIKDPSAVKFLLENGLDINSQDTNPLTIAISNQAVDTVKILIENGAKLDIRRWLPLRTALTYGNKEILDIIFTFLKKNKMKIPEQLSDELIEVFDTLNKIKLTYPKMNKTQIDKVKAELKVYIESELSNLR